MNELYVTKNKYFDKTKYTHDIFYPLMGDAILMSQSTEEWSHKRKSLSGAFYKDKLVKMLDIVKECM